MVQPQATASPRSSPWRGTTTPCHSQQLDKFTLGHGVNGELSTPSWNGLREEQRDTRAGP
eukprot:9667773-Alexandrium_andersonii.AAC.1